MKARESFKYVNETCGFVREKQHNRGCFDSELSSPHIGPSREYAVDKRCSITKTIDEI